MESRHRYQYHQSNNTTAVEKCTAYSDYRSCVLANDRRARFHNSSSTPGSPDVIERDSRSVGVHHYPPSLHHLTRPLFLSRSPVMDNEKDMTRTPTTPKSPPVPVSGHDAKISESSRVLSRGAHMPPYHGSSSGTAMSSSSSESERSGHHGGSRLQAQASHNYQPQPATSGAGGGRMGMRRQQAYPESSFHHHAQYGVVGGAPTGSDRNYGTTQKYDAHYKLPPSFAGGGGGGGEMGAPMYNRPAQTYSSYPSESYGAYRSNYSRPLSTGSLSTVSTASSRPGFSSLDEFPTMYDHHSTFAPQDDVMSAPRQHRYGAGAPLYPYPYHQLYDDRISTSSTNRACVDFPISPPSCDDHQPLLSLPQQGSALSDNYTSDEMAGQLTNEMSRNLSLQDQRTPAVQNEAREQQIVRLTSDDEVSNCIRILEHPKDVEVFPNERAVLRCVARIVNKGCGQLERAKGVELKEEKEEEPNLLWYKDAEPLIGEIDGEFLVEEVTEKDVGLYYCLVSHPDNEQIQRQSKMARLTIKKDEVPQSQSESARETGSGVVSTPEIVKQPPNELSAVVDERLKISVKAAGSQLSFIWYKDNKELRYADGPLLVISSARYSDSGVYCCSISNAGGSVLSKNCLVKVTQVRDSSAAPSGFKRPSSIYGWGDQPLSDAFLRDVGTAVARQTTNLNRIGLYLGLRNADIVEINRHFRFPEEQAFHMLRLWSQKQQRERATLKIILTQAGIKLDLLAAGVPKKKSTAKPPRISVHPKSTQVTYGHSHTLNVQLEPTEPAFNIQYQWYRNDKPLVGKTSHNFTISSVTEGDAGEYYCIVSNHSAKSESKIATLEVVNPHATPGRSPLSSAVPALTASSAFVNPSSAAARGYQTQWGHRGHYDTTTARAPQPEPNLPGKYPLHQPVGEDFLSRGAPVGGNVAPPTDDQPSGQPVGQRKLSADTEFRERDSDKTQVRILKHPQSQQVEAGDPLTLTCSATGGSGQLTYTWYFNGLSLAGEDRAQYEINCFTDEDEGLYQCKVQSTHEEVMSRMAHIQMKDDPSD